jgi:nicotinate phosphoribosyltransferase
MSFDTVTVADAPCSGQPLLQSVMQGGTVIAPRPGLIEIREYTRDQLHKLPAALRKLSDTPDYPVLISPELQALAKKVDEQTP